MELWVVQQYAAERHVWVDVNPDWGHDVQGWNESRRAWQGVDAGDAFNAAVLANPEHHIQSTSYRVLQYTEGMTFNLSINVEPQMETVK